MPQHIFRRGAARAYGIKFVYIGAVAVAIPVVVVVGRKICKRSMGDMFGAGFDGWQKRGVDEQREILMEKIPRNSTKSKEIFLPRNGIKYATLRANLANMLAPETPFPCYL